MGSHKWEVFTGPLTAESLAGGYFNVHILPRHRHHRDSLGCLKNCCLIFGSGARQNRTVLKKDCIRCSETLLPDNALGLVGLSGQKYYLVCSPHRMPVPQKTYFIQDRGHFSCL